MSLTSIFQKFRESLLQQKLLFISLLLWLILIPLWRIVSFNEKEFAPDYSDNNFQIFGLNIPRNLEFAGERVPKNDYRIKESLEKELFTNTYWKRNAASLYARAQRWFPYIEPILKSEGVPDDFKYVAVIESHLKNVVSPRGASGFWQLIEPTAAHYGLQVGPSNDQRYDVEKATHAACKLIKAAHKEFNNWTLAAAAYNLGIGGIQGKMSSQNAESYYDLLLNKETGSYVYRILAYKTLFHNPSHFGIKEQKLKKLGVIPYKTLNVDSAISNVPAFCMAQGIKESAFYSLNPWIRMKEVLNPEKTKIALRIPKNKALDYSDYYADLYPGFSTVTPVNDSLPILKPDSVALPQSIRHLVKEGEDLKQIAEFYKTTVAELLLWNNLPQEVELKPETELIIYTKPNSNPKEEISDGHEKNEALPHDDEFIEVIGARAHNLKNISLTIPRNKLVVLTGLSGSGKSSLAFDTIYAEGQRRYIESFSSYARQFLGNLERPDVDKISGLSPVISIEQKTVNKNPRSTVGTITEIYDFLRLLYARAGDAFSYVTGEKMVRYSDEQIVDLILEKYKGKKINLLAPIVKGRKGHYRELFEDVRKKGFSKVRVDGEIRDIVPKMQVDRYKIHDIEIVIDRLDVKADIKTRLAQSLQTAMKQGKGTIMVIEHEAEAPASSKKKAAAGFGYGKVQFFSRSLMCPTSGVSYDEPAPNLFSFNSPYGACPKCNGLGVISEIDINKIVPNPKLSIKKGAIAPLGEMKNLWIFKQIEAVGEKHGFTLDTPFEELDEDAVNILLFGTEELIKVKSDANSSGYNIEFEGIASFMIKHGEESPSPAVQRWVQGFTNKVTCPTCEGTRLKKEALYFKIDGKNISELAEMDINVLNDWFKGIEKRLSKQQNTIAKEVLKEIRSRIVFLLEVGLDYVTLNRSSKSLSGGEAQRIRLATQIGSQLVGVLYILDEPSIGLHQRDNTRLIEALKNLRDAGNSILVVEHDKDMIVESDHVIDIGPGAGVHGGKVVANAKPQDMLKFDTLTAQYITGKKQIETPRERRKGNGKKLVLKGATGHNLKNVSVDLPLGKFICVTGVSGSGKSSLINETLYPILSSYFYNSEKKPLAYKSINGLEHLDKVIDIDQSPIGRTPRSNPATYTNVFSDIRNLFAELPEAKIRGYKPGRFSFNVKGGRCETCGGAGVKTIEMNFLPDVYVVCDECNGKRYNRETLEVRYKGKSISDVLNMTIDQACEFFENVPSIFRQIKTLQDVGLGYITLGQQATTLSGGEAQRVKLATELSKRDTGNTFYILDEPTTGLHFEDIRILLEVLNRLVNNGNTVLVIEHNMDIIRMADHVIDLGPEGGRGGGEILFTGTPEEMVKIKNSHTAKYLKKEL